MTCSKLNTSTNMHVNVLTLHVDVFTFKHAVHNVYMRFKSKQVFTFCMTWFILLFWPSHLVKHFTSSVEHTCNTI